MEEGECLIILCQYGIGMKNHVAQLLYSSYLLSFCQEQCNIALIVNCWCVAMCGIV